MGGLTVLRAVRARLPDHDLVYLADQARVPYGPRAFAELFAFLEENVAYLSARGADAVVMACNTSSAVMAEYGRPGGDVAILDLIEAAAEAVAATGLRRIGVVATDATVRSGAYGRALHRAIPGVVVQEVAAPELVPLVEAGITSGPRARDAVARAVAPLREIDAVVLACTHYPLLDAEFAAVLGPQIVRLDPAQAQADATVRAVAELGIPPGSGTTAYATTGDPDAFARSLAALGFARDAAVAHVPVTPPERVERRSASR